MNGPAHSETTESDAKPALGLLAWETYHRDLPRLLDERPGQWVAYHGDRLVGFAESDLPLYQECLRRGFRWSDFLVGPVEPAFPDIVDSPYPFD